MRATTLQSIIGAAALGIATTAAPAALLSGDSFNYTGTELNGQDGGVGWSGAWTAVGTNPSPTLSNDGVSLTYPGSGASSGSRVSTGGLSSIASSDRVMGGTIDLSGEGNVGYASALFRKNADNGGEVNNDNVLIEFRDAGGNRRWGFGIAGADDAPWLNHNGSTSAPTAVTPGATYLLVTKVISHASDPDEYFLKVYGPGYSTEVPLTEPTTWDAQAAQGTGAILDRLRVRIDPGNTAAAPGEIDELRVGTDWASVVTAIPEPSSLTLLGLAGLTAMRRRRA